MIVCQERPRLETVTKRGLAPCTQGACTLFVTVSKPLWTLDSGDNVGIVAFGAKSLEPEWIKDGRNPFT